MIAPPTLIEALQLSLVKMLVERRQTRGMTLAAVAAESGISASTLSRLERYNEDNAPTFDLQTTAALMNWLSVSAEQITINPSHELTMDQRLLSIKRYMKTHNGILPPDALMILGQIIVLVGDRMTQRATDLNEESDHG